MQPNHSYYLYIGGGAADIDKKSIRFVVETNWPMQNERHFSGRVVARKNNAQWHLGYETQSWGSPIGDAKDGLFTSFVRVPREYVKQNFPDNIISDENS